MKERPILFTPENAQKVHDGVKVQTRRILKPQPVGNGDYWDLYNKGPEWALWGNDNRMSEPRTWPCPYGQVGDRLWIREAFHLVDHYKDKRYVVFKDGGQKYDDGHYSPGLGEYAPGAFDRCKWKPSIHMPRWACRTVVELTEIRVERVQEISEEDCIAEGVEPLSNESPRFWKSHRFGKGTASDSHCEATAQDSYRTLWSSINGQDSWAQNPWVWVLTFKKVEA